MKQARWEKVRRRLRDLELDAFLFLDIHNIHYLSGFTGSDGALLVSERQVRLLVDSRYTTQAQQEFEADSVFEYHQKTEGIFQGLEEKLAVQNIDPRCPWLNDYALSFSFK